MRVQQRVLTTYNQKKMSKIINSLIVKLFAAIVLVMSCMESYAQNSCDKLFSEGVSQQQIMTIPAQKKAISAFEKAKACYDAKKNKDLCEKQIKVCRNTITLLSKKADNVDKKKRDTNSQAEDSVVVESNNPPVQKIKEITLSIAKVYVKFKGKGGEFQKVKVECNDDNWAVSDCPSWVHYSINSEKEIVLEVDKNPSNKEERSGTLAIKCGDKSATLTIIQEKNKKIGIF